MKKLLVSALALSLVVPTATATAQVNEFVVDAQGNKTGVEKGGLNLISQNADIAKEVEAAKKAEAEAAAKAAAAKAKAEADAKAAAAFNAKLTQAGSQDLTPKAPAATTTAPAATTTAAGKAPVVTTPAVKKAVAAAKATPAKAGAKKLPKTSAAK